MRIQDSITEVPGAPAAIEGALREILLEGKNVRAVLDELQRQLTNLAQEAKK